MIFSGRIKKLRVSNFFLEAFLIGDAHHFRIVSGALPEDVQVIDIIREPSSYPYFYFIVSSRTWPELKEGQLIPEAEDIIYEKIEMNNALKKKKSK